MNNTRRQKLHKCSSTIRLVGTSLGAIIESIDNLSTLKKEIDSMSRFVTNTIQDLDKIYDEESNAYYSFPENLQESEIGIAISDAMDNIDESKDDVSKLLERLDELEEIYYQFLANYKPEELKTKIESIIEEVEECRESIEYATKK